MRRLAFLRQLLLMVAIMAYGYCAKGAVVLHPVPIATPVSGAVPAPVDLTLAGAPYTGWVFNGLAGAVTLQVTDNVALSADFSYKVIFDIDTYDVYGTKTTLTNQSLSVNYRKDQGVTYKGTDNFTFNNAVRATFTFKSYSVENVGDLLPPTGGVGLVMSISEDHTVPFAVNGVVPVTSAGLDDFTPNSSIAGHSLAVHWSYMPGAQEYDLEWTVVDAGDANAGIAGSLVTDPTNGYYIGQAYNLFRNSATRITTSKQDYKITLAYNDDYLVVRIRGVQYNSLGIRVPGAWTYVFTAAGVTKPMAWAIGTLWHEQGLNWQFSASFAEEAKKKEVISYFDGSLRNRQTVTVSNSNDVQVPVVQENIYDMFGRATASVLPAPTFDGSYNTPYLHYFKMLNVTTGTPVQYDYKNVLGTGSTTICEPNPDPIANTSGASKYYSVNNNWPSRLLSKYIPDAENYPFSVTQYTPDNTGRIKLQGGVGKMFQPGQNSPSKTTRYYYGVPEQWELDQLFGNDAGYASHYMKNMVIDPNNQVSLSYVNASGKTVATALAGATPASLDQLPSATAPKSQTIKVLSPDQFKFDNGSLKLSATTTYLVPAPETVTFVYDIQKLIYTYAQSSPAICSSCYYKATIKFVNACDAVPFYTVTADVGAKSTDAATCAQGTFTSASVPVTFANVGEYNIIVEFALDRGDIENYLTNFLTTAQASHSLNTEWTYLQPMLDKIDFSSALGDCKTAVAVLGSQADFTAMMKARLLALNVNTDNYQASDKTAYDNWISVKYASLSAAANALTCTFTPCNDLKVQMLRDVSPNGQYAMFDKDFNALEPEINVIYQNWRKIFPVITNHSDVTYLINRFVKADGSISSANDANAQLSDVARYWNPVWSAYFFGFHPELCKYTFCVNNENSFVWDEQVRQVADDATKISTKIPNASGLSYDYSNGSWLIAADPFFRSGGLGYSLSGMRQSMLDDLNQYSTRVLNNPNNDASVAIKGLSQFVNYSLYITGTCAGGTNTNNCWNNWTTNTCAVNRDWATYKTLYLELKKKYYVQARNATTCLSNCSIGVPYVPAAGGGCANVSDFSLRLTTEADSGQNTACSVSQQRITVSYTPGKVTAGTYVYLYYAAGTNTTGLPTSIYFAANTSKMFFCLPLTVPLSSVSIKAVNCTGTAPAAYSPVSRAPSNDVVQHPALSANFSGPVYDSADFTVTQTFEDPLFPSLATYRVTLNPNIPVCTRNGMVATILLRDEGTGLEIDTYHYFQMTIDPNSYTGTAKVSSTTGDSYVRIVGSATACSLPLPANDGCPEAYQNKISRFDDPPHTITYNPITARADVEAQNAALIAQQIQNSCDGNADRWMKLLAPGLAAHNYSGYTAALRFALVQFCAANGDSTHPFGASTNKTGGAPLDFGAVMKNTIPSLTKFYYDLNPWLLEGPPAYNIPVQSASMVVDRSSLQIKTLVDNAYAARGSLTFYQYLVNTYGAAMTLSSTELDMLKAADVSCNYILPQNIILPAFFQPGVPGCQSYATFNADRAALMSTANFFTVPVGTDPNDPSYPYYQAILTNYMNQKYGFALGYSAYDGFTSGTLCNNPPFKAVAGDPYDNVQTQLVVYVSNAKAQYTTYINTQKELFRANYIATCSAAQANVNFTTNKQNFHYTLYYYDQADNLIRTVPPEGVTLLTAAQISQVQQARDNDKVSYTYTGPTANSDKTTALNSLSTTLSAAQGAIEMWLYNSDGSTNYHVVEVTPDKKWLFQFGIWAGRANIDIYPLTQSTASSIAFNPNSRHYRADISSRLPLNPFTHVVIQGPLLGSSTTTPQLYINGTAVTLTAGASPAATEGFGITATASTVTFPDVITTLKHLRLYYHQLSAATITANAANTHFVMADSPEGGWYRFNVPGAGSLTTAGPGTTNETTLFGIYNKHTLITSYTYNATNQVVQQNSPDGGTKRFWYDMLSRLNISQDDKQLSSADYSYTKYDVLGRITEVGQKDGAAAIQAAPGYLDGTAIANFNNDGTNNQITSTYYDTFPSGISGITLPTPAPTNLRKRVVVSSYRLNQADAAPQATYYSYDIDGNVKTLWQQLNGSVFDTKQIDYEYDLVSGKVNFVRYQSQAGQKDHFYYKYEYDAENRLTEAWSGTTAIINPVLGSSLLPGNKKMDASYRYYLHGPLARTELGDVNGKVQGIDYAYTLQGWLKGVNNQSTTDNPSAPSTTDMGQDGFAGKPTIARDAYSYSLGYYTNDYKPAGGSTNYTAFNTKYASTPTDPTGNDLFNGNISNMTVSLSKATNKSVGYTYRYDQLNRLKKMRNHPNISTAWNNSTLTADYSEDFTYDGNGNIMTAVRNGPVAGSPSGAMDNLAYQYSKDANGRLLNNKLGYIDDAATGTYTTDLKDQASGNYGYDAIGNIVKDGTLTYAWTVYGKLQQVTNGTTLTAYQYDASGKRVIKQITNNGVLAKTTYYVRDAQGNPLAIYDVSGSVITLKEQQLYGSSRLGTWSPNLNLTAGTTTSTDLAYNIMGQKYYELTNHLGNVMATISDKRLQTGSSTPYYLPDVVTQQDYYSFGAPQPGDRTYVYLNHNAYRYGFNGKENDDDVGKGVGNSIDFGGRIYDSRVGRWLSTDPLQVKYPDLSPYNYVANNPIYLVDPDGKVIRIHYIENGKNKYYVYKPGIKPTTNNIFVQQVHEAVSAAMKSDVSKTLQKISDSKRVVTVNQIFNDDDKTDYNRQTFTGNKYDDVYINWDAKSALRTTKGGGMTPANGLLHEAVHALRMISADTKGKVDAMQNDLSPNGSPYENAEEQRVIQQVETPYTNQSNMNAPLDIHSRSQVEGTRSDHYGTPYKSKGVNSITPAYGSKQKGESTPIKDPVAPADHVKVSKPIGIK